MKHYDKYKPSGVDWIGKLPVGWDVIRLKYKTLSLKSGGTPSSGNENFYSEDGTPWVTIADMSNTDYVYDTEKKVTEEGIKDKSLNIYPEGTLLYSIYATLGKVSILKVPATINQAILAIALKKDYNQSFLKYNFKAMENYVFSLSNGNTQYNLNAEKVANFFIVDCPFSEQTAIADYLDAKCSKIDNVVEVQQKRIELLKELKQSIITNAVTKGLDKNVELKTSGIEWIGDIPEKWTVKKVSWLFQLGSGTTPKSGNKRYYVDDGGYNWLQTGDLNDSFILETSKKISKAAIEECNLKIYPKGSMVVAMYGATIGKTGILNIDTAVNQACCVLKKSKDVNEMFAFYMFQAGKPSLLRDANGGGQPNISQEIIAGKKFAIPPYKEQLKIVDYLNKKNYAIDNQISKIERQIELLKEYKQSIITECVTGKRKVC